MKRQFIIGLITTSLLVTHMMNITVVFADNNSTESSVEQIETDSTMLLEDSIFDNRIEIEKSMELDKENSENSTSEMFDKETETSMASSEEESEEMFEDVYYNNQWFRFPIQQEVNEPEKKLNENHQLGTFTKPERDARSKVDHITEFQKGRPRWDFIDVSSHQGELSVNDYEYMKKYGVTGVVVKLTEGVFYTNPLAKNQIENAQKAGLKVSTYHFSRYTTKIGAESEATYYAEEAKRLNLPANTIMVNDLEVGFNEYSTQNAIFFANKLKEFGYDKTIHYSSENTFKEGKLSVSMLGEPYLWVAQYPYKPSDTNILHSTRNAWQWSDNMTFTSIPNKKFDVNMDHQGTFSNPIVETPEIEEEDPVASEENINKYGTIISKGFVFWEDLRFKEEISMSSNYFQQTLYVEKEFVLLDGSKFVSIKDNKGKFLGYVDKSSVEIATGEQGVFHSINQYVTIKGTSPIWGDFNWTNSHAPSKYKNQTMIARGIYYHFSGTRYLSLYDNENNWIGYINENGTKLGSGEQGAFQSIEKYATIRRATTIFEDFSWSNSQTSDRYINKTFKARGIYYHFNGSTYLSIYDNTDKWIGYIDEIDVISSSNQQGAYHSYDKYVSMKGVYDIWDGFEWKNKTHSGKYKGKTFHARGIYYHFNGSTYLSIYDNTNKWIGYINDKGVTISPGAQGNYEKYNKYVTVKSEDYAIWQNFSWSNKAPGKFSGKTFLAKSIYNHFNGSRYLSLYDTKDNWVGYINETGTKLGKSQAEKFKKVQELLNKEYKSKNFGIYVTSLADGSVAQINGTQQFHAASTGKLPVLYYTQKMILDKKVNGDYPYVYTDAINQMPNSYMRGGAGVLQGQPYGKKFSLNTMMNWTAKYSDNQGTNFLAYYAANKYDATMKREISKVMGRNWTSPFYVNAKDNAKMLEAIYHQGGKLITDLSNTIYDDQRIPKYLPVQVAHKIGDVEDLRHDAGIIYTNEPYTLSILTKNYQTYEQISILSKKIYDILK